RGQDDERGVGTGAERREGRPLIQHLRTPELDDVVPQRDAVPFQRLGEGLALQLGDGGRGRDGERNLIPHVGHHHANRDARLHRRHATTTPEASGRVEKNRSTAWSKNRVDARTCVRPPPPSPPAPPAGPPPKTTSSPPLPPRTTESRAPPPPGPARRGSRSGKKRPARLN